MIQISSQLRGTLSGFNGARGKKFISSEEFYNSWLVFKSKKAKNNPSVRNIINEAIANKAEVMREREKVYKNQIDNYQEFIQKLVIGNKILARRFYVVIPYTPLDKTNDFEIIKEQMHLQRDIILRGLEKLGMKARPLNSLEILDLFYGFYNSSQTKTQELKDETFQLMKEAYV